MKTTCKTCGAPVDIRPNRILATGNYCSRACHYASGAPRPNRKRGTDKSCEVCGATFYASAARPDRRFCSMRCKGIASRLPKNTCVVCGKEWQPRYGQSAQPCCSRACGHIYRGRTGNDISCVICGTVFHAPKARSRARCCSAACLKVWQGRNKTNHVCKICGKTFRWSPSRTSSGKYNVTYCSIACRNADPVTKDRLIAMNVAQQRLRPNHVERAGYAMLDGLGVTHERQHLIGGKFCVDAFVPSPGVVVQFDGDYWHGNPAKFPEPDARQRKRMHLDRSQDAYMKACGYRVVRIWASDIEKHPQAVTARLRRLLVPKAPKRAAQA